MMLETFFDSEYLSQQYSEQDETYSVHLMLWNGKLAKIVFSDTIGFYVFPNVGFPMGLRNEESPSVFFHDALLTEFEKTPEQHEYKCYEVIDIDEMPFIKVVAKGYEFLHYDIQHEIG